MLDDYARRLADRLGGLPLALATAGAYLRHSAWTFEQYLSEYEKRWNIGSRRPIFLPDYQNRTLYTTWDLSYQRLKADDPEAAEMLKLLAYFGRQSVWFELFQGGAGDHLPDWLRTVIRNSVTFDSTMVTLVEYCFVEVQARTQMYSMHSYIHDWTLYGLNPGVEQWSYWYVFDCVAEPVRNTYDELLRHLSFARYVTHALRLTHIKFNQIFEEIDQSRVLDAERIARLLSMQIQFNSSVSLLSRIVLWKERTLGASDMDTLATINDLGNTYINQGRLVEAEQLFSRALAGFEEERGPDHPSTLTGVLNLAGAYNEQGKLVEAEQLYRQVLVRSERALNPDDELFLSTVHNLGMCLRDQGRLVEAEETLLRALAGRTALYGPHHIKTLSTVNSLGDVYKEQGRLAEAEPMYRRALSGRKKALGADHLAALDTVHSLGLLYGRQSRLEEAEQMFRRAVAGREKILGPEHILTLSTISNLGIICARQGKLFEAEQCYKRAWAVHSKTFRPHHALSLMLLGSIANAYATQGQLVKAEQMFLHGLADIEEAPKLADLTIAPTMMSNLGNIYEMLGNIEQAEVKYIQALAEYEKIGGSRYPAALTVVDRLGRMWTRQGRLYAAEQMLVRAVTGFEEVFGEDSSQTIAAKRYLDWCRQQQDKIQAIG